MKLVMTGASGKAGRAVVRDLVEHQHDILAVDVAPGRPTRRHRRFSPT